MHAQGTPDQPRAGPPYLKVELGDSTGSIVARAFSDADLLAGRFERGELVRVRGRVERFREKLQIDLDSIARAEDAEVDPAGFLPTAYRDLDELEGFLEHLGREVYDPPLKRLLAQLLGDATCARQLRRAPCSLPARPGGRPGGTAHHAYLGGLLEHTVAVATLALELCALHPRLDRDLLLRRRSCTTSARRASSRTGRKSRAARRAAARSRRAGPAPLIASRAPRALDADRRLQLEHCVLCHHGADVHLQAGFASAEAVALFRLNSLDAGVKGAVEQGLSKSPA